MLTLNVLALAALAVASPIFERQACSTTYSAVAGWSNGKTQNVCYDTGYYRTADQGQTTTAQLQAQCQAICSSDSSCKAVVARTQYAADSDASTGLCFIYAFANPQPRACNDAVVKSFYAGAKQNSCSTTTSSSAMTTSTTTRAGTVAGPVTTTRSTTSSMTTTSSTRSTTPSTTPSTTRSTTRSTTPSTTSSTTRSTTTIGGGTVVNPVTTASTTTRSTTTTAATTTSQLPFCE